MHHMYKNYDSTKIQFVSMAVLRRFMRICNKYQNFVSKPYQLSNFKMGLDATKPVFGVSDKASFKQVSSATETS